MPAASRQRLLAAPLTGSVALVYWWAVAVTHRDAFGGSSGSSSGQVIPLPLALVLVLLPFLGLVGPLLVWAWARTTRPVVRAGAAGAFNLNLLSCLILYLLPALPIGSEFSPASPVDADVDARFFVYGAVALVQHVLHLRGVARGIRGRAVTYPVPFPLPAVARSARATPDPAGTAPTRGTDQFSASSPATAERVVMVLAPLVASWYLIAYGIVLANFEALTVSGRGPNDPPPPGDWVRYCILALPLVAVVGPLLAWLWARRSRPLARRVAAGAFNLNALALLLTVLIVIPIVPPILLVVALLQAFCHPAAVAQGARGRRFTYPITLPVLRPERNDP